VSNKNPTPRGTERELIEAAQKSPDIQLVNWPPSRGPKPPEMRYRTTYRYRRVPAIERLPAPTKLPKREQIREGYMSETGYLRLCVPVSRAADLKVGQASAIISGAGVVLSQVSLTRFLDARTYVCDLQAYLSHTARVTIEPYTIRTVRESDGSVRERKSSSVGYLLAMLGRAYRSIYRDHEAWGVWGHEISDLVFESLSIRDNIVTVGIGS